MKNRCKKCGVRLLEGEKHSRGLCAECDLPVKDLDDASSTDQSSEPSDGPTAAQLARFRRGLWITVGVAAVIWISAFLYGLTSEKATASVALIGIGVICLGVVTAVIAAPVMWGGMPEGFSVMNAMEIMVRRCWSYPQPLLIFVAGILLTVAAGLELEHHKREAAEAWKRNIRPPAIKK